MVVKPSDRRFASKKPEKPVSTFSSLFHSRGIVNQWVLAVACLQMRYYVGSKGGSIDHLRVALALSGPSEVRNDPSGLAGSRYARPWHDTIPKDASSISAKHRHNAEDIKNIGSQYPITYP